MSTLNSLDTLRIGPARRTNTAARRLLLLACVLGVVASAAGCADTGQMQAEIDAAMSQANAAQQTANQAKAMASKNQGQLRAMGGGPTPADRYQGLGH